MDRNVNLNLNILRSSANKKEPGNISTRGNLTSPRECLCSTQTICRTLCKREVIIFTSYHECSVLRVKEWMIHLREALFVSKLSSKTTVGKLMTLRGCASRLHPVESVFLQLYFPAGTGLFLCCCRCGVTRRAGKPVTTRHDVPCSAWVMSETPRRTEKSL